jgi:polar amino acid transport system substrate-binding protein
MLKYILAILIWATTLPTFAASETLKVGTVTRPPFSFQDNGAETGFSMELWQKASAQLSVDYEVVRFEDFGGMLNAVQDGTVDLAIANISITSDRETVMDFSHPIFESGLQVMVPNDGITRSPLWDAILSRDLLLTILLAFALLFTGGMVMWAFERRAQPYFDRPPKEAMFPSFWWALNLVVNGGFEERAPQTFFGRIFGVLLVISSLFVVSIFVAHITSVMTVEAINTNVNSVNDLYGKQVGTIRGSTAASYLDRRDLVFRDFDDLGSMTQAFVNHELDAVVFDAPVLAYYVQTHGRETATLAGSIFLREDYGIALPTASPWTEAINQSLLSLRENGDYDILHRKWFGSLN